MSDESQRTPHAKASSSSRRQFVKAAAVGTAGVGFGLAASTYANIPGANERVRIGVVGIRGMGFGHIKGYTKLKHAEVAALCDVDENILAGRMADVAKMDASKPDAYVDIRKLLEDKNIDAISVATPNHWHALAAFWAAQAGKHAAIEKPGTHNIFEGQQLIKAAEKYNVLIQHHAERRTFKGFQEAVRFLHEGGLGEIYMAKGLCYKWRNTIGQVSKPQPIPAGVDYDLWLGPAPHQPLMRKNLHYDWHWQWDYGNGDIGNQGAHQMDIARWGLGVRLPTHVTSVGGHFMFDDDQQTPNSQFAWFEFPAPEASGESKKKVLQFEVRHWITNHEGGFGSDAANSIGNLFYGSEGYMSIDGSGNWQTYLGKKREPGPSGGGGGDMFANFVETIRAGDRSQLEGDIVEGHYSCALIHLANTSYRLGRSLRFDPQTERYLGDDEANAMLSRDYREPFVITREV